MAQLLKSKEVASAALKAYEEGRLGFQHAHHKCRYTYEDGSCCAIGAGLSDETKKTVKDKGMNGSSIDTLIVRFAVETEDRSETLKLRRMQELHDGINGGNVSEDYFVEYIKRIANGEVG